MVIKDPEHVVSMNGANADGQAKQQMTGGWMSGNYSVDIKLRVYVLQLGLCLGHAMALLTNG